MKADNLEMKLAHMISIKIRKGWQVMQELFFFAWQQLKLLPLREARWPQSCHNCDGNRNVCAPGESSDNNKNTTAKGVRNQRGRDAGPQG